MLRIKRLYLFMLQRFLPLFIMTFFICLFIVLMQFLWRYIDDLVGKGLDVSVIIELFFYAALTMIPLALPLAILLASLMVFGNLGEKFELTAMKAAGVSLIRIMAPLIVCVSMIAVGAFFFQNNVLPKAQVKMWTLLFSMRQKSPELDIPEGTFYEEIQGYNIYIKSKNRETGVLHNLMIYDVSNGYGTANIIVADSGKLSFTQDKRHLYLKLINGESFEDLKDSRPSSMNMLYRRESFDSKEILIPFDANFTKMDEGTMKSQYIGKNITELRHSIDSINTRIDSIGGSYAVMLSAAPYFDVQPTYVPLKKGGYKYVNQPIKLTKAINADSLMNAGSISERRGLISDAIRNANQLKQDYEFKGMSMNDDFFTLRRHDIELQKKFTLAIACLIFFFIGAPLGSIIRKGGLAVPIVVSVLLFVVYYIIDNSGLKLAKEGIWEVWEGIWLSTAILAPLGVFLTYKATHDSAVFNADAYRSLITKIIGKHETRNIALKELILEDISTTEAIERIENLKNSCNKFLTDNKNGQHYIQYWLKGYSRKSIYTISDELESIVKYLSNSHEILVINKLMDYPILRHLFFYHPTNYNWMAWGAIIVFPIGITGYIIGLKQQMLLKRDIRNILNVSDEMINILKNDKSDNK